MGVKGIGGSGVLSRHQLSVILHTAASVVFVKKLRLQAYKFKF